LHQTKLVAAQTPFWCAEHNSLLFPFLSLFFEQELVVFSPSFDQYTSFLLTLVTTQHNFQLRGRTRINQDGWCSTKKKTREGNMWRVESKGGMGGVFFLFIYMQQAMTIRSRIGWNKDKSYNDEGKKFSN
jgi:hypothetical protein